MLPPIRQIINARTITQRKLTAYLNRGMFLRGGVFCNPPYGREIGLWVKKAYEESLNGQLIVMLLPARTDTKWFHDYILNKAEIRFVRGRLKFGDSNNSAPFPSMVVVYNRPENNSKAVLSEIRNERTRIYNNFDGKPM